VGSLKLAPRKGVKNNLLVVISLVKDAEGIAVKKDQIGIGGPGRFLGL
jgi:hypothetical protein